MKIKCLYDTGEVLTSYRRKRLYVSNNTEYGLLEIGREYLVMGMMLNDGFLSYLMDDSGLISVFPSELFKVTDNRLPNDWFLTSLGCLTMKMLKQHGVIKN